MIFSLFVLDLLGFVQGRVVRWGRGDRGVKIVYFVVVLGAMFEGGFG